MNYLQELEALSTKNNDNGMIHSGAIHYIRNKSDILVVKKAIYMVLENCPEYFPKNLPELVKNGDYEVPQKMENKWREINEGLLFPLDGYAIVNIIELAKEYEYISTQDS